MIVKGTLIIVGIGGLGFGPEKLLGEPEHIVGIARFGTLPVRDHAAEIIGIIEMLADAVAAESQTASLDYVFPEEEAPVCSVSSSVSAAMRCIPIILGI